MRSPLLFYNVVNAVIRCTLEHITIAHSRYLMPSTSESYYQHCRQNKVPSQTVHLQVGGRKVAAHWLGNPEAETAILYFHGGGYTQSVSPTWFKYLTRLIQDVQRGEDGKSVAVLMLAYTLAPEATYPTQLREAVSLLSHVLTDTGRSPGNIILSGDSAGGNLALALMSHMLHPHPDVPVINLQRPLGGALLYSPWVSFRTDYPSFSNEKLDNMAPIALRRWSAMFLGKADTVNREADPGHVTGDAWTEATLNTPQWWEGLHRVVGNMFVWYGGYEVFADSIRAWKRNLNEGWIRGGGEADRVTFLEAPKEAHVAPIGDFIARGKRSKSESQIAIEEWYRYRLEAPMGG